MKYIHYTIKGVIFLFLFGSLSQTQAQLVLDFDMTDQEIGQNLVGTGIEVVPGSIQVIAADSSYAFYDYTGANIGGNSRGLLITTGNAENGIGPNDETGLPILDGINCLNCDYYDNEFMGSELISLANNDLVNWDACHFEFSFIPQGDSVTFEYSFASEEYLEWVGSSFNDAFGFFVSGPGIGTDVNVALLDDGFTTVAINNVNHIDNSEFFFHNNNTTSDIQYDGYTINTKVQFEVESCEEYTIKLIVADGTDRMYDSGVFIEELSSNPITIETSTTEGTDFMIEGCNDGTVTFVNPFIDDEDAEVIFQISGTADLDVDYTTTPDINTFYDALNDTYTMTIPSGQPSVSFDINTILDGIEGSEIITISLLEQFCDTILFESQVDFEILDELPITVLPEDASICPNQSVQLEAIDGSNGVATIVWSPIEGLDDPNSLTPIASPDVTTTYTATSTLGACINDDSVTIDVTPLSLDFEIENISCEGNDTGSITLTVNGGQDPYTISWTGPDDFTSSSTVLTDLPIGTYCVDVIDANGCGTSECVNIIEESVFNVVLDSISTYSCANISCFGEMDGFINITVSGGTGDYTFDWSNGDETEDIMDLGPGFYTIIITDDAGCTSSETYEIVEPDPIEITLIDQTDVLCDGTSTGSISVEATGGCPIYEFAWSHDPNLNAPFAGNLVTGNYTVSVSDANGCSGLQTLDVFVAPPIDPLLVVLDNVSLYPGGFNVSCPGASDGTIDITISDGTPDYTVLWTHVQTGTEYTEEDPTNLACGDYELLVTDANGCEFELEVELTCVPDIEITFTTVQNPCDDPNASIGEIHITGVSGGHGGPYTTSWISGPSCPCVGDDLFGLNSGIYIYEVIDALGCVQQFPISISINDLFTVDETIYDETCFEECNGAIDLEIAPFPVDNIVWFNDEGFSASTDSISNLCEGDYSVTITLGDCEQTFDYSINSVPEIEIDVIDVIDPSCIGQNDGSIEIGVSGGVGILNVNWLPDLECDFPGSSNLSLSNLFACDYIVEVTDENLCTVTETVQLDSVQVMDIFIQLSPEIGGFNVACNGDSDANIDVTVSGGTPDCVLFDPDCYFYDWADGDDVSVFGNDVNSSNITVGAGTYIINVTDANGCLATTSVDITEPDSITDDPDNMNMVCGGEETGQIVPNISGGTGTYTTYEWTSGNIGSNPIDADTLLNVGAGTYDLFIEDSNGCSETFSYVISESIPIVINIDSQENISCFEACDGSIAVSASGGTGILTYEWTGPNNPAGTVLTNLCPGTYILTVTDEMECSTTMTIDITEPEELILDLFVSSQLDSMLFSLPCRGDSVAIVEALITGGTADYMYTWEDCDGNFISNDTFLDELPAGCFSLDLEDANGCLASDTIVLTEPDEDLLVTSDILIYPNGFNISCFDAMDGEIDLTVSGGVPNYTYLWELNNIDFALTEDVNMLDEGLYEVLVIDDNGCDTLIQFQVVQPPEILINSVISDFDGGFNISCADSCDGEININPTGGLGSTFVVEFENEITDSLTFSDLCFGSYEITVTDSTGCTVTDTLDLVEPDPLTISEIISEISCFDDDNGGIISNVSGGSGVYFYSWTPNGEITANLSDLAPDTYCVDVEDSNGCETSECWTLTEPDVLTASAVVTDAECGLCNGEIDLTASGGTGTLDYSWGTEDQSNLCPDDYTVVITDDNNCTETLTETVGGPDELIVNEDISDLLCDGDGNGAIDLTLSGGNGPFNFEWFDVSPNLVGSDEDLIDVIGGIYSVEITWDNGNCLTELDYIINEPSAINIEGDSPEDSFGYNITTIGGTDGSIDTDVDGGTPDYDYSWNGPTNIADGTQDPENLAAGTYTLSIIDANGCMSEATFILTEPSDLFLPTGMTPNGDGANDFYVIPGITSYGDNTFTVFNRWGNIVYEKSNYDNTWNGQNQNGDDLPNGTYFIVFEADELSINTFVDLRR